ncbi:MAG: acyltransferase [Planctomycetota bacterium]
MSRSSQVTSSPAYPRHLAGADGVRGLACLLVVVIHLYNVTPDPHGSIDAMIKKIVRWEQLGLGVGAFFVLSGMLLSYPFWKAYADSGPMPNLGRYANRRIARIVPAFTVASLVSFVAFSDFSITQTVRLIAGLLYLNSFHYQTFFPVEGDPPLWSIGIEMQFYLLLAIPMVGVFAWRRMRPGLAAAAGVIAGLAAAIAVGNWAVGRAVFEPMLDGVRTTAQGLPWSAANNFLPFQNPIGLFAYFLVGVLSGWGIVWLVSTGRAERWRRPSWGRFNAFDGAIVAATLVFLALAPLAPHAASLGLGHGFPIFPVFMMVVMTSLPFTGRIGGWLDLPLLRWVGVISYGLYLWHYPSMLWVKNLWHGGFEGVESIGWVERAAFGAVATGLATLIAAASWYGMERPVVRWSKRLESGGSAARQANQPENTPRSAEREPKDRTPAQAG